MFHTIKKYRFKFDNIDTSEIRGLKGLAGFSGI